MTRSTHEDFCELIALTQLYLLNEFPERHWMPVDSGSFNYFKEFALQTRKSVTSVQPQATQAKRVLNTENTESTEKSEKREKVNSQPLHIQKEKVKPDLAKKVNEIEKIEKVPEKAPEESPKQFVLQPPKAVSQPDFHEVRKLYQDKFPGHQVVEPPKPVIKQEVPPIIIISSGQHNEFFHNLVNAIQTKIMPARLLNGESANEMLNSQAVKLIITTKSTLQAIPALLKHYHEENGIHFLGKIPLCVMLEVDEYLKNPKLKISLWNSINSSC